MPALSGVEGFNLIAAIDRKRGIGREGRLPWELPFDMRFFRELTTCPVRAAVEQRYGFRAEAPGAPLDAAGFAARIKSSPSLPLPSPDLHNAVLMGRKTWDGLPPAYKPLPNRLNGVLSRREGDGGEAGTHREWPSLDSALRDLSADRSVAETYVIGGAQVYHEALARTDCARIYLTEIDAEYSCDVFFPALPPDFHLSGSAGPVEEKSVVYRFLRFERRMA